MMPKPIDFLVIAPTEMEWDKIKNVFVNAKAKMHTGSTEDDVGTVNKDDDRLLYAIKFSVRSENGVDYEVVVIRPQRICRVPAAVALRVALRHWYPVHVLLVGIAGALQTSGLSIGQVAIPHQIYDYERASSDPTGVIEDMRTFRTSAYLGGLPLKPIRAAKVLEFLDPKNQKEARAVVPELGAGDIVFNIEKGGNAISGDKKIKEVVRLPEIAKHAKTFKIHCVEMEAGGVAEACDWDKRDFLMVRGISDIVGVDQSESAKEATQQLAATSAALAALEIISKCKSIPAIENTDIPAALQLPRPIVLGNAAQAFNTGYPLMYVGSARDYQHLASGMSSRATDLVVWVSNGSPLKTRSWNNTTKFLEEWDKRFRDLRCRLKARLVVFRDEDERAEYCNASQGTAEAQRIKQFKASCGQHLYFTTLGKISEICEKFELPEGIDMGCVSWLDPHFNNPVTYCFCSSFNTGELQEDSVAIRVNAAQQKLRKILTVFNTQSTSWERSLEQEKSSLWQAKRFYDNVIMELCEVLRDNHAEPEWPLWLAADPGSPKLKPNKTPSTAGGER